MRVRLVSLAHQSYMACIHPSYCYARQKFDSSISASSLSALISQSNAVGSRKMNQCDIPDTFLTPCFLLMVPSFFHSFPVFLNFSFLSRQYLQVTRAVYVCMSVIFSNPKINCIKMALKNVLETIFVFS